MYVIAYVFVSIFACMRIYFLIVMVEFIRYTRNNNLAVFYWIAVCLGLDLQISDFTEKIYRLSARTKQYPVGMKYGGEGKNFYEKFNI